MRVVVLTDVHANLPALKATLQVIQKEGYDLIFHTGDAIALGPFPAECLDLLLNTPNMRFIMGNHDYWYAYGLPKPIPNYMNEEELKLIDKQNVDMNTIIIF